eukprot:g79965.t1
MLTRRGYDRYKEKTRGEIAQEIRHKIDPSGIENENTNDTITKIHGAIPAVVNRHKRRPKDRRDKPWIHPRIKRMIGKQHKVWAERKDNPTQETISKHSRYKQIVKKAIKQEKRNYLEAQLELTKDSPKAQAAVLRQVVPRNSTAR